MGKTYFSIIIVSLNAADTIKMTLDSVLAQKFSNYEIIVKDGCSKDQTVANAENYKSNKIEIFVESDTSIYEAMNQATHKAKGKYIIYMNCGDMFSDNNVLKNVYECTKDFSGEEIIYGNYERDGRIYYQRIHIDPFYLYRTPLCHQTVFWGASVLMKHTPYDLKYKILADYDLTLRLFRKKIPFIHSGYNICKYLGGGVSESVENLKLKEKERRHILKKFYSLRERFKFDLYLILSLRRLRRWITSNRSPKILKKVYHIIATEFNK